MGPQGVACLDVGVPVRYSHQATEVVDPTDIEALVTLLDATLDRIGRDLDLIRAP
jgi:putative aminopeptidase FrvX